MNKFTKIGIVTLAVVFGALLLFGALQFWFAWKVAEAMSEPVAADSYRSCDLRFALKPDFTDDTRISFDIAYFSMIFDACSDHIEANQSVDAAGIHYPIIFVRHDSILVVGNKSTDFSYHDNYYAIQYVEVESPDTIALPCILNDEMAARVADRKPMQTILPDIPQVRQFLESDHTYRISALPNWSGFQVWDSKNCLITDILKSDFLSQTPEYFGGLEVRYSN